MELINQIDEQFKFENKEIRVIGSYNEPFFIAKDICNILELSNILKIDYFKCLDFFKELSKAKLLK